MLEYDRNPEVANYFCGKAFPSRLHYQSIICAMRFLHQGRDGLHPRNEEYDDTLGDFTDWSGPCGLGKRW